MRANPAQHSRQRQPFHNQLNGLPVFPLADKLNVALHVDARRAGDRARRPVFFVDTKCDGYRLGKRTVDRRPCRQALIPFTGYGNRANFGALPAAGAHPLLYVTRFAMDLDGIIADVAGNLLHLTVGKQLDVGVLGHFNHFRGSDAGRTVKGGKSFVKLQHVAADSGLLFHQVYLVTGIAEIQGGLHTCDAATDHHHVRVNRHFPGFQLAVVIDAADGRRCQGFGLARGVVFVFSHPGNLLPYGSHLEKIGIEPGPLASALKGLLVQPRGAGCHHHPVQTVLFDVRFDHLLARVRTHKLVIPGHYHIGQLAGKIRHLGHTHPVGNIDTAMANVKSDFRRHGRFLFIPSGRAAGIFFRQSVYQLHEFLGLQGFFQIGPRIRNFRRLGQSLNFLIMQKYFFIDGRNHDHRNRFKCLIAFQVTVHLDSSFSGHHHVQNNQIRLFGFGLLQPLDPVFGINGLKAAGPQKIAKKDPHIRFIIDN